MYRIDQSQGHNHPLISAGGGRAKNCETVDLWEMPSSISPQCWKNYKKVRRKSVCVFGRGGGGAENPSPNSPVVTP